MTLHHCKCFLGLLMALQLGACTTAPVAPAAQAQSWSCSEAADGARARRSEVEQAVAPAVFFEGETLRQPLVARLAEHKVAALSVAVIRNGELDWTAAYGHRSAGEAPIGCNTLFQGGSLAKPVTLLAALRMSRAGLIDLDRNVETSLRSFQLPAGAQTKGNPVTLRHLLAHTSGLTPGGYDGYAQGQSIPGLVEILQGTSGVNSPKVEVLGPPGVALRYSGGGYTLAQLLLQEQSGQAFDALMHRWVLDPVGMRRASFGLQQVPSAGLEANAEIASIAPGHRADGTPVPGGWHNHPESAAAGLWATPSDLARLLIEVWKGYHGRSGVFDQGSIQELLANPMAGHAYGFRLVGSGEDQFITHYGGTAGYNAGMTINLRSGQGAVYLSNSEQGRIVGPEFLSSVARVYNWPHFREMQVRRAAVPDGQLRPLAGSYDFAESKARVRVDYADGALALVFPNGDRYVLVPIVADQPWTFIHPATGVHVSFASSTASGMPSATEMRLYGETGVRDDHR